MQTSPTVPPSGDFNQTTLSDTLVPPPGELNDIPRNVFFFFFFFLFYYF